MTTTPGRPVYAAALDAYWAAGWRSVLPLPPRAKKHPPTGYTGREAAVPSYSDCYDWAETRPDANIALRLPPDVIGIDVDHYDGKDGGGTLAGLIAQYGPLPATWTTGSRADGVSGIRLYRVPEGLRWPGDLGGGIEVIQARHRYAIVWPSIHPKTGGTYVWSHPDHGGVLGLSVPHVDELPELPQAWVDGLTSGMAEQNIQSADLDERAAMEWVKAHGSGAECRFMEHAAAGYLNELATGTRSRHEVIKDATMRLSHMAAEGHRGAFGALGRVRTGFLSAMAGDAREPDAPAEWFRLIMGAVRIAAMDTIEPADPCDNPLHGLMEQAPASPAHLLGPTPPTAPTAPTAAPPVTVEAAVAILDEHAGESLDGLLMATEAEEDAQPAGDHMVPSWLPIDLGPYLDGSYVPEEPTMMMRTDGVGLIYPGLVHDFHGESESGKSLVAQAVCAGLIQGGQEVVYLDFESGPGPMAQRMIAFGCTPAQIMELFIYVRPELNPYALTETDAYRELLGRRPALVILDGVTDALVQFGAGSDSNDEITKWHRYVPRTIADRTKAAVVLIDHVVKSTESRGRFAIGGQAKLATIDGASYNVEIKEPIGKGMRGLIVLRVGKDRPGTIRPNCGAWRAGDRSQEAVRVVIDSTGDSGLIRWDFLPPETSLGDVEEDATKRVPWVPTGLMEKTYRALETYPGRRISKSSLQTLMESRNPGTKKSTIAQAIGALIADGHLVMDHGLLIQGEPYRQPGDPAAGLEGLMVPEVVDDSYGRATSQPTLN